MACALGVCNESMFHGSTGCSPGNSSGIASPGRGKASTGWCTMSVAPLAGELFVDGFFVGFWVFFWAAAFFMAGFLVVGIWCTTQSTISDELYSTLSFTCTQLHTSHSKTLATPETTPCGSHVQACHHVAHSWHECMKTGHVMFMTCHAHQCNECMSH